MLVFGVIFMIYQYLERKIQIAVRSICAHNDLIDYSDYLLVLRGMLNYTIVNMKVKM